MLSALYDITETLNHSPRTTIHRARRRSDGRAVVVKLSATDYPAQGDLTALEREHTILGELRGAGIVDVLGLEEDGARLALVLEDAGRRPGLRGQPLSLQDFLPLAVGVTRALASVHARGIVHRDINPDNIALASDGKTVKLIDFSIAIRAAERSEPGNTSLTGTLAYLSPEQTGRMNRPVDHRSDLYSLGITFFELLSGAVPFQAADAIGYVHCHLTKAPPPLPSNVPEVLAQIVARLMAKDPDARYQTATGLLHDLEECQRRWSASADIGLFPLGARDRSSRLEVAKALVERQALQAQVVELASDRLVVLSGAEGVGKSALLREVGAALAPAATVVFASCEAGGHIPLGVVRSALAELASVILASTENELLDWQTELRSAVGNNGHVLLDLVPELAPVLGEQPPVPELPPREAAARRTHVFRAFLRAATARRPLVIALDALQWVDAPTTELLINIMTASDLPGLTILGALRDGEAGPFDAAFAELTTRRPEAVARVAVPALSVAGVSGIVAATLAHSEDAVVSLAQVVFEKTGGNPLFVAELIERLYRERALWLDDARGVWAWDERAASAIPVRHDVLALMMDRLERLEPSVRAVLEVASCQGTSFAVAPIERLIDAADVGVALVDASAARVIAPAEGGTFSFAHHRLREALHDSMAADVRARVHHGIARNLIDGLPAAERASRVFEIVAHAELGRVERRSREELEELIQLELEAADQAQQASGQAIAAQHLASALACLDGGQWSQTPERHFAISRRRAECVALAGDTAGAGQLAEGLHALAHDPLSRSAAYRLEATIREKQALLPDAIDRIRRGLAELDVALPADPPSIGAGIGAGLEKMQAHLAHTPPAALVDLPVVRDPVIKAVMELLVQLIPSAFQSNPPLFVLAELMLFDLAVTHGVTAVSSKNFVDCGIIQVKVFGDQRQAVELSKAAYALLERFAPTPVASATTFVDASFTSQWCDDVATTLEKLARAHRVGAELGDVQHASYAAAYRPMLQFRSGTPLATCRAGLVEALAYARSTGEEVPAGIAASNLGVVEGLMDPALVERGAAGAEALLARGAADTGAFFAYQQQALSRLILGDLAEARRWVEAARPLTEVGQGTFVESEMFLVRGVLAARLHPTMAEAEQAAAVAELTEAEQKLGAWAAMNPSFFGGAHKLLVAECARVQRAPLEVIVARYDEAIEACGTMYAQIKALATERHAELWLDSGRERLAKPLLVEAAALYERWGSATKVKRMEEAFPRFLARSAPRDTVTQRTVTQHTLAITAANHGGALDIESVVKATQAISSEVKADRLFGALMATIIENAGAQRGCLVVKDGNMLTVEARASVDGSETAGREPLASAAGIARDVVLFVARSLTAVVIDDASAHPRFASDAHVRATGVRSLLCVPVLSRGELLAIMYAENNALSHAFTAGHLKMLNIIAGQTATSIQNARMYENLEQKVAERTRALADKNREIRALFDGLPQGVCTFGDDLLIQPGYSAQLPALTGTDDLVGQPVCDALFAGSALSADRLSTHDAALRFSFGVETFMADINWGHLIRSFERPLSGGGLASFEVEWTPIVDDNELITKVLATVRDVTAIRALERKAKESERESALLEQVLSADPAQFPEFCARIRGHLAENAQLLAQHTSLDAATIEHLFRNLHTIKGNARTHGLYELADAAHHAEAPYAALRGSGAPLEDLAQLRAGLEVVSASIDAYDAIVTRKLGALVRGGGRRADEALAQITAELTSTEPGSPLERIRAVIARHQGASVDELAREAARMFPSLARELGKPEPVLEVKAGAALIEREAANVLQDVLVHVFRNAFDHGIEPPDQRVAAHKPPAGTIEVRFEHHDGAVIRVRDDGRGLSLARLRAKLGADSSDEALAEAIFRSGVSTAEKLSEISGRGVGLDAVRAFLTARGGSARVEFTAEEKDGHRPIELVLRLPATAIVG